jgi:hypothetical protein
VYRPSTGAWYFLKSSTNYTTSGQVAWGRSTDIPVPSDYDGDGRVDPAVYRPSTGQWLILKSSTNYTTSIVSSWGLSTDTPINLRTTTGVTITFDGLTIDGAAVTTYTESGFTVLPTSGDWVARTTYGNPAPFIQFDAPAGNTITGEVQVTAGGSPFVFKSVDLYSSTTPIPYTITGLRNSIEVFALTDTLPNTFGNFRRVLSSHPTEVIDTLSIRLTNSAAPCCRNPMGLDNIVMLARPADAQVWNPTGNMAVPRRDHTATLLSDGTVLIIGWITLACEIYDPDMGVFTQTGNTLVTHGQGATSSLLPDGRVLIVGGTGAPRVAETYNPVTHNFSLVGIPTQPRQFHTATPLLDGTVLIAGGNDNSAEIYDPTTDTFRLTGSLSVAHGGAAAAALLDGRVLVVGGSTPDAGCLDSAEIYDPAAETFTPTGPMAVARCSLWWTGAPVLPNGQVLILGGLILDSAELFDPETATFSQTGSMTTPRAAGTATLLPSGGVLVAGGSIAGGPVTTNSAELYDPESGSFTATASMTTPRQQHTATLLLNGQVLVAGGFGGGTELTSAELFSR